LHRDVWPLMPTSGDEGARPLLRAHPDWVQAVACLGSAADIDTLEDLARWKS
jgi:CTP:molybdopterin cytidylyltransferase MocA